MVIASCLQATQPIRSDIRVEGHQGWMLLIGGGGKWTLEVRDSCLKLRSRHYCRSKGASARYRSATLDVEFSPCQNGSFRRSPSRPHTLRQTAQQAGFFHSRVRLETLLGHATLATVDEVFAEGKEKSQSFVDEYLLAIWPLFTRNIRYAALCFCGMCLLVKWECFE